MQCESEIESEMEDFWIRIQRIIPPGEGVSWQRVWREFGRGGTGPFMGPLIAKGYLRATIRGSVCVNEKMRGKRYE